jgi:DNA-binding NarL/FixJ family response regulator
VIKVLIADDHAMMRNALRQLCEVMEGIVVAGEAANGDKVMEALRNGHFDLVLLDLTMPGVNGVDLIERIHAQYKMLPILIFSMRNEFHIAKQALKAGASGYLTKESDQDILMSAIRTVAAGRRFVDPFFYDAMVCDAEEKTRPEAIGAIESLSQRELQVFKLLAQGRMITDIADELAVSQKTVGTFKARLMKKMKFGSVAELAIYASEYGLNKTPLSD